MVNQNLLDTYLATIQALIENSKIDEALVALRKLDNDLQAGLWQNVILISGEYNDANDMYNKGIITGADLDQKRRRVRYVLTELLKEAPKNIELNTRLKGLSSSSKINVLSGNEKKLEKIIGASNTLLRINWLEKGLNASKAVCRIVFENGKPLGTGFMTPGGYLFTNHHVIDSKEKAATLRAEFNFEFGLDGKLRQRTLYRFDANDFITSPADALDFTRIKVIDDQATPLSQWGMVEFAPDAIPSIDDPVNIIQHPAGEDKQIALNANEVLNVDGVFIQYAADTLGGSSGSPVFNQDWKVVALHHAGVMASVNGVETPANEGILFRDIFAFINGGKTSAPKPAASGNAESIAPAAPAPVAPVAQGNTPKFVVLYHQSEQTYCDALNDYLYLLKKRGKLQVYNLYSDVKGGGDIRQEAGKEIATADYLICLVTAKFLNSEWLDAVLTSNKNVIPVRVTNIDLKDSGLEHLRSLPSQNRTIPIFGDDDAAYTDIVNEIRRLLPA